MLETIYEQRGYLHEDFRLFHLRDPLCESVDWHYHTFHKIVVLFSGGTSYGIEGKSYLLQSGDVVLVSRGCIHRPEAPEDLPHERMILYISPEFLKQNSTDECDLEQCFSDAAAQFSFVLRPGAARRELMNILLALEQAQRDSGYGQVLLKRSLIFQFLIAVSRGRRERQMEYVHADAGDEKIVAILQHLSRNFTQEVSIDDLASQFYISKYHMMRRFKEETGYTIHNYIVTKRLMLAREQIAGGMAVGEACYACGFRDYSAFARAYRNLFSQSPREAR